MIQIYSTLSEQKEPLPARRPLRVFVCGPTVYNLIHIGNARTYVNFDLVVRWLRYRKVRVKYLQNITDIDDKIIRRAAEESTDWKTIAERYTKEYLAWTKKLGITSVDIYAPATKHIKNIERQVRTLMEKGYAYVIPEDGIYFDISKFADYGKLARRTVEQAEDGVSRIDASEQKKNRGDFCVWKFSKEGEPLWKSKLGDGRPGWHIEDTAITEHFFGPQYEMHGGARDLIFPHHEAEIAQQESASGKKPLVQIWMHAGFLTTTGGEKMSKSLGNFTRIDEALRQFSPATFRMMTALHHYRAPMEITGELVAQAEKNLADFAGFLARLDLSAKRSKGSERLGITAAKQAFEEAMDDDFTTPRAFAALFSFMNDENQKMWQLAPRDAKAAAQFIREALGALGFSFPSSRIPRNVAGLASKRELLRSNKQFTQSDALRQEIERLGYVLEDTPLGPLLWQPANPQK